MAAVVEYRGGLRRVEFSLGSNAKRRAVRLGRVTLKDAQAFALRVEALVSDKVLGRSHSNELAAWLKSLPEKMLERLRAVGLTDHVDVTDKTLADLITRFNKAIAGQKPATVVFYSHTLRNLRERFGAGRLLSTITEGDADEFVAWLRNDCGLAKATANRRVKAAITVFKKAVRWKLIAKTPFDDEIKGGSTSNKGRARFVPGEVIHRLIAETPDPEWRALLALARWCGLRTQSEGLGLRVDDLDWERSRIRVRSPKTEHHGDGHESRLVPMFPEVREHLLRLYELAEDGQVYLFDRARFASGNLRTGLLKLIRRAGLKEWPRLWHNLRASRATELVAEFPMATAAEWLGHSVGILANTYIVEPDKDADFAKAVSEGTSKRPAKRPARPSETDGVEARPAESTDAKHSGNHAPSRSGSPTLSCAEVRGMGSEGPELSADSPTRLTGDKSGASKGPANYLDLPADLDRLLADVAAAWRGLDAAGRADLSERVNFAIAGDSGDSATPGRGSGRG